MSLQTELVEPDQTASKTVN